MRCGFSTRLFLLLLLLLLLLFLLDITTLQEFLSPPAPQLLPLFLFLSRFSYPIHLSPVLFHIGVTVAFLGVSSVLFPRQLIRSTTAFERSELDRLITCARTI